jgi:hypothetical protein
VTSHAEYDALLREQTADSLQRGEGLRHEAADRSRVRRRQRVHQRGTWRFAGLCLAIIVTTLIVTYTMFQVLAVVAG